MPVPLEDWWLVRDSQGRVGWLLARRMDVDVAEEIAGYAEGWKIVGAYVLATVNDPESNVPNKQVPEYVAVLNPYKDGLPYDFSQVRVFTWNLKKHRYETAFRQRNVEGYLPVTISRQTFDNAGPVPTFQFKQAVGGDVATDAGPTNPAQMETETYRLDGVLVKKVVPVVKAVSGSANTGADGYGCAILHGMCANGMPLGIATSIERQLRKSAILATTVSCSTCVSSGKIGQCQHFVGGSFALGQVAPAIAEMLQRLL